MYPCGDDIAGTNLLWCMYGNCQFDEHIIRNWPELFVYSDHAYSIVYLCSISCILFTFIGITFHWKVGKHTFITTHSTDSEVHIFYIATKNEEYIGQILEFLGVEFHEIISG